jgi:hypothetical protein
MSYGTSRQDTRTGEWFPFDGWCLGTSQAIVMRFRDNGGSMTIVERIRNSIAHSRYCCPNQSSAEDSSMACDRPHHSQRCTSVPHFSWDPFSECGIAFGLVITCTGTCLGRERMVCTTGQCGRIGAMESIFDSSVTAPNALLASIHSTTLHAHVVQVAVALSGTISLQYHIREIVVPVCKCRPGSF